MSEYIKILLLHNVVKTPISQHQFCKFMLVGQILDSVISVIDNSSFQIIYCWSGARQRLANYKMIPNMSKMFSLKHLRSSVWRMPAFAFVSKLQFHLQALGKEQEKLCTILVTIFHTFLYRTDQTMKIDERILKDRPQVRV